MKSSGRRSKKKESRLIAFPGVSHQPVPAWRKELSERVREVQERRARELALEAEKLELQNAENQIEEAASAPQLELLHQPETPPLNPIVAAALRRIERAYREPLEVPATPRAKSAVAAAAVRVHENSSRSASAIEVFKPTQIVAPAPPASPSLADSGPVTMEDLSEARSEPVERGLNLVVAAQSPPPPTIKKAKRLIVDDPNDPALNYLDSIPTTLRVEEADANPAPAFRRLLAAIVDLIVVIFIASPFAAAIELIYRNWNDPSIIGLAAGIFAVVVFIYATVSTALTGRTLGMKLLALRVVDARTGLIPTGSQSAGRALVYLASFFTLGISSIYALIDRDKRTAHDRLTRTAVVRA